MIVCFGHLCVAVQVKSVKKLTAAWQRLLLLPNLPHSGRPTAGSQRTIGSARSTRRLLPLAARRIIAASGTAASLGSALVSLPLRWLSFQGSKGESFGRSGLSGFTALSGT